MREDDQTKILALVGAGKLHLDHGSWRWGLRRSTHHRGIWLIGSALFAAILTVVGAGNDWPNHAHLRTRIIAGHPAVTSLTLTRAESVLNGLIALGIATVVILTVTILWAVFRSPYEQREMLNDGLIQEKTTNAGAIAHLTDALDRLQSDHTRHVSDLQGEFKQENDRLQADLKTAAERPVSEAHAARLKKIAAEIAHSIEAYKPSDSGDTESVQMFRDHFHAPARTLDRWDDIGKAVKDAYALCKEALREQVHASGLDQRPFSGAGIVDQVFVYLGDGTSPTDSAPLRWYRHPEDKLTYAGDYLCWVTGVSNANHCLLLADLPDEQLRLCQGQIEAFYDEVVKSAADLMKDKRAVDNDRWAIRVHALAELERIQQLDEIWGKCDDCDPTRNPLYKRS